jgi:hypothetical protein
MPHRADSAAVTAGRRAQGLAEGLERLHGQRSACGPSGAALIKQENAVVPQGPVEPVVASCRPRTSPAGTAIEEAQPRQVTGCARGVLDGGNLACEHSDPRATRIGVIERHVEMVVSQDGAWLAEGRHARHAT